MLENEGIPSDQVTVAGIVRVRRERMTLLVYTGYLVGSLVAALIVRGLSGPPADPGQDVVDLSGAYVVLGALVVGGPAGIWLTMRLAGHQRAGFAALVAAAMAIPAVALGQILLLLVGLDDTTRVSNLVTATVTCAPAALVPAMARLVGDRR